MGTPFWQMYLYQVRFGYRYALGKWRKKPTSPLVAVSPKITAAATMCHAQRATAILFTPQHHRCAIASGGVVEGDEWW